MSSTLVGETIEHLLLSMNGFKFLNQRKTCKSVHIFFFCWLTHLLWYSFKNLCEDKKEVHVSVSFWCIANWPPKLSCIQQLYSHDFVCCLRSSDLGRFGRVGPDGIPKECRSQHSSSWRKAGLSMPRCRFFSKPIMMELSQRQAMTHFSNFSFCITFDTTPFVKAKPMSKIRFEEIYSSLNGKKSKVLLKRGLHTGENVGRMSFVIYQRKREVDQDGISI